MKRWWWGDGERKRHLQNLKSINGTNKYLMFYLSTPSCPLPFGSKTLILVFSEVCLL
jgi:hypothetical protein